MERASRNTPCPCGSGKKYKNCCLSKNEAAPEFPEFANLPNALRMKGGVRHDPAAGGFVVIVHMWDNIECRGEPREYRYGKVFAREDEALRYYKTKVGPPLMRFMEERMNKNKSATFIRRELE